MFALHIACITITHALACGYGPLAKENKIFKQYYHNSYWIHLLYKYLKAFGFHYAVLYFLEDLWLETKALRVPLSLLNMALLAW